MKLQLFKKNRMLVAGVLIVLVAGLSSCADAYYPSNGYYDDGYYGYYPNYYYYSPGYYGYYGNGYYNNSRYYRNNRNSRYYRRDDRRRYDDKRRTPNNRDYRVNNSRSNAEYYRQRNSNTNSNSRSAQARSRSNSNSNSRSTEVRSRTTTPQRSYSPPARSIRQAPPASSRGSYNQGRSGSSNSRSSRR
ncbi:hypothetical protein [Niabella beijingensis]|uniref:hypothetical protein n=1 Tax=Niabella beijingensis TaxID=2872700 RepID=UPI001CBF4DA9|nr:hypothetical protein [Niabella beijingensis]MBZ4188189.1 hypothetical protein [Niabella beijingensis]